MKYIPFGCPSGNIFIIVMEHMNFGLIRGVTFGGRDLIRGGQIY
jgi:hypothetical protein